MEKVNLSFHEFDSVGEGERRGRRGPPCAAPSDYGSHRLGINAICAGVFEGTIPQLCHTPKDQSHWPQERIRSNQKWYILYDHWAEMPKQVLLLSCFYA